MADIIGTPFDDLLFAASGDDVFGLHGRDMLVALSGAANVGLVGGPGGDSYTVQTGATVTILEAGGSPDDSIAAPFALAEADFIGVIDGRHLLVQEFGAATTMLVIDWEIPANRIETWAFGNSIVGYDAARTALLASPVNTGVVTVAETLGPEAAATFSQLVESGYTRAATLEQASGPPAVLAGTEGADSLDGGPGSDSIDGLGGADTIRGLDGADLVYGGAGDDDVNGNRGSDTVFGGAGADFARGGQEADWVFGGDGDDWHVNGNIGDDVVLGGNGDDAVFGGQGADTLAGHEGADTLSGDRGDDLLFGDMIFPSLGTAEVFLFHSDGGNDTIFGFDTAGGDRIAVAANLNGTGIGAPEDILGGGNAVLVLAVAPAAFTVDQFLVV